MSQPWSVGCTCAICVNSTCVQHVLSSSPGGLCGSVSCGGNNATKMTAQTSSAFVHALGMHADFVKVYDNMSICKGVEQEA